MQEAVVDPFEPAMPGKVTADQALKFAESLIRDEPNRKKYRSLQVRTKFENWSRGRGATSHDESKREKMTAKTKRPSTRRVTGRKAKRWVADVKTVSTFPPKGLFTKSAATIARSLASKRVSPKGPGSGMRMLTYFMNRGGRSLSLARRRELEKAKKLLSERMQKP
jgi:tRNA(adenine34) deaminase